MGDGLINGDIRAEFYRRIHTHRAGRNEPRWRGVHVVKFPSDLILYSEVIHARSPDYIIETGTRFGGSALFFADMMSLFGGIKVISIDVNPPEGIHHQNLELWKGSSSDRELVAALRDRVGGASVMVVLDSDHSFRHVRRELRLLGNLVTKGQFIVVEDCYTKSEEPYHPWRAVEWFLARRPDFVRRNMEDRFVFSVTRGGWLERV